MSTNISNPSNTTAKVRWREPYVSQGLNMKFNGTVPAGILRGGLLGTNGAALSVTIQANNKSGDSVYSYIDAQGEHITFRQAGDITLNLGPVAGTTVYVALYIDYQHTTDTVVYWRTYSEAELYGGAPVAEADEVVVLGRVVVPGAGVIPAANITPLHRIEGWSNISRCAREWRQVAADGDFEMSNAVPYSGANEEWPGWDEWSGLSSFSGMTAAVSTAQARTGERSLHLNLNGVLGQVGSLYWAGRAKVYPGQLIDISIHVMGVLLNPGPGAGGHIGVTVEFYQSTGVLLSSANIDDVSLSGSFSWTEVSNVIEAPANAAYMGIYVAYDDNNNSSTGDIYFDDLRVWLEVGESRDPLPAADDRAASIRTTSLDLPPTPATTTLSSIVQETLRLRQDLAAGGLRQLFLGARGTKSTNPFNLLLENGAVEIQRVITRLGSSLLGSAANAVLPRVTADVSDPAVGEYTLLALLPQTDATKAPIRLYASGLSTITGTEQLFITVNAEWDSGAGNWDRDIAGDSLLAGVSTGGLDVFWYPAAGAAPWVPGAWFSGPPAGEILMSLYRAAGGKTTATLEDLIFSIVRTTAVTNPAVAVAPTANSIYAKNIPKAWVRFEIQAGAPPTINIHDAFNVNTIAVNAAPTPQIEVTFHNNFANVNYAPVYSHDAAWMAARTHGYMTGAQAAGLLTVDLVNRSTGVQLDAGTVDNGGAIIAFGQQTS